MGNVDEGQDIIDSRDVIKRIEELEEQQQTDELDCTCAERTDPKTGETGMEPDFMTCGTCEFQWCARCNPTPSARTPCEGNHLDEDEAAELKALRALAEECEGYAADWEYGEALIADSHFEDYARELAEDTGAYDPKAALSWPLNCIDWKEAAELLKQDYTSVTFGSTEYWIRS